jgi:hypothetical protein
MAQALLLGRLMQRQLAGSCAVPTAHCNVLSQAETEGPSRDLGYTAGLLSGSRTLPVSLKEHYTHDRNLEL